MTFTGNMADSDGGALSFVFDNFRTTVREAIFHNDSAGNAGG